MEMKRSIFDIAVEGCIDETGKVSINEDTAYMVIIGDISKDDMISGKLTLADLERLSLQRLNRKMN